MNPVVDWTIDRSIARARTLPARVYCEPAWLQLQARRVFPASWQFAGAVGKLAKPGHVRPLTLLPGILDQPLLLASDEEATLRCLSNVCTHRGNLLVSSERSCRVLRCGYHGRRFGLDGRFLSMPCFEEVQDFPAPADNLPRVQLERFGPLLFLSLQPTASFERLVRPLVERTSFLPWDRLPERPNDRQTYHVDANWALYCDNYLEGFHIPYVHPGLAKALELSDYSSVCFEFSSLQLGIGSPGEPCFELPDQHPDSGQNVAAFYFFLFPSTMINVYPWGISLNQVLPRSVAQTDVIFESYVWNPGLRERGAGSGLDQVELEDEAVVASVQQGVRSQFYDRGRYSPTQEAAVHHFHRLLTSFMRDPEDRPPAPPS